MCSCNEAAAQEAEKRKGELEKEKNKYSKQNTGYSDLSTFLDCAIKCINNIGELLTNGCSYERNGEQVTTGGVVLSGFPFDRGNCSESAQDLKVCQAEYDKRAQDAKNAMDAIDKDIEECDDIIDARNTDCAACVKAAADAEAAAKTAAAEACIPN